MLPLTANPGRNSWALVKKSPTMWKEFLETMSTLLSEDIMNGQVKHCVRRGLDRLEELLPPETALLTDVRQGDP